MGKRQLLFVTYFDEHLEEGISYAIELAKAMFEDITLLFVQKQNSLMDKFENMMAAVSFAEAGEHDTAKHIMTDTSQGGKEVFEKELDTVVKKCFQEGIQVHVHSMGLEAISGIRKFLKEHTGIDKVVLSPAITEAGNVTAKDLNRLVRTASRPIVTMTRQSCAVA
jgi:predicted amidohydrolase YtcJ